MYHRFALRRFLFGQTSKYLFVPYSGEVAVNSLNPITGVPSALSQTSSGADEPQVVVDPSFRFVYVYSGRSEGTPPTGNGIWGYSVDATSGMLTPMDGSPFATTLYPASMVIDQGARYAYVGSSYSGADNITTLSIDTNLGVLTPSGSHSPALAQTFFFFCIHRGNFFLRAATKPR